MVSEVTILEVYILNQITGLESLYSFWKHSRRKIGIHCSHSWAKADATEQRLAMAQKAAEKDNNSTASTQKRAHPESSNNLTLDGSRKKFKQAPLKTYRGIDMPFSEDEKNAVQAQALRAVISANLPFRAMENPEMLKLFRLLRTAAPEIIPSRRIIGGRLLDDAAATVDAKMRKMLRGREVGVV